MTEDNNPGRTDSRVDDRAEPAGINTPGAAGRRIAPRDVMVDPNDESTLQEGMQHADGSRA